MPAEETTTWSEVCKQVGFRDNLYRTCRDKVAAWQPAGLSAFDEIPEEPDFTRRLAKTAKPIPRVPKDDAPEEDADEPESFFDAFPVKKLIVYGGVAAVAYFLLMRKSATATAAPKTVAVTSSDAAPKAA